MRRGLLARTAKALVHAPMLPSRKWLVGQAGVMFALSIVGVLMRLFEPELFALHRSHARSASGIPIAVLGDSDSRGFRDSLHGGVYHDVTWGWPDIWYLRRPTEVDLGRTDLWGTTYRIARIRAALGLAARAPAKFDYDYNYASSYLGCNALLRSEPESARWLLERMAREPERWNHGLVVIRIGLVDIGLPDSLEVWSKTGLDASARAVVDHCVGEIGGVVIRIRKLGTAKVALVGVTRGYNRPKAVERWPDDAQARRMEEVLGYFDAQLTQLAVRDEHAVFVDEITWYRERMGDRMTGNLKSSFVLGGKVIRRAHGDAPEYLLLEDEHAGTVMNGLWLNFLISKLNQRFGLSFTPIEESEILELIERHGAAH